uniref:Uncharacterized protein n=1 Tax=Pseudonaja textilis TaxID=8673 RepID=A0A670ZC64_PSETE
MKVLVLTLLFLLIAASEAKQYSRCSLASCLKQGGLDGYYGYNLANWVCMAYYESRYNTNAVGQPNLDGSRNYGIFQINSETYIIRNCQRNKHICDLQRHYTLCLFLISILMFMIAWRNNCKGRDLSKWIRGCQL